MGRVCAATICRWYERSAPGRAVGHRTLARRGPVFRLLRVLLAGSGVGNTHTKAPGFDASSAYRRPTGRMHAYDARVG